MQNAVVEKPWAWVGERELARGERQWRELDTGFEVGIAEQLLFLEPFPALTFGSASVESTATETSSISEPRAGGDTGEREPGKKGT